MKTKVLKFGMPIMAFLLAIVFAFATSNNNLTEDEALVSGYIFQNGDCLPASKDCSPVGTIPCTYQGQVVHRFKNGTVCQLQLFEWMN